MAERLRLQTEAKSLRCVKLRLDTRKWGYGLLNTVSDPNIAYILLLIGLAGLYFELSNPGVILPGVIGGISLILAFYSLQTLSANCRNTVDPAWPSFFLLPRLKLPATGCSALEASFL